MIPITRNIILALMLIFVSNSNAQKFGFGCLGLSGFYVGISEHHYKAQGINNYVNTNAAGNLIKLDDEVNFNLSSGYRIGANFFRAKWDQVFITAKGFFQFLKEEHALNPSQTLQHKFQLNMNQWGVGVDIGIPITSFFDWKIIEGGVTYYNSELVQQQFADNSLTREIKFAPEKGKTSYYVATGIIVHIIPDYMSLEGTAAYNVMNINEFIHNLPDVGGSKIKEPFSKYGFSGTFQLNISFPF
ncbi:MAG: hypothetical protein FD143_367 [Ignavibacteria bacterium]|nr:MAG: hypothetical protein FD143_367 [Ignavibacteria bacterium]KAF0161945.1 MAG: hypothetical protein FD188_390 [Ignavibacteria bacterium]